MRAPTAVIAQRISRQRLEEAYNVRLPEPSRDEAASRCALLLIIMRLKPSPCAPHVALAGYWQDNCLLMIPGLDDGNSEARIAQAATGNVYHYVYAVLHVQAANLCRAAPGCCPCQRVGGRQWAA